MTPKEKASNLILECRSIANEENLAIKIANKITHECLYLLDTQCEGYQEKMLNFWNGVRKEIEANEAERSSDKCHIQNVSGSLMWVGANEPKPTDDDLGAKFLLKFKTASGFTYKFGEWFNDECDNSESYFIHCFDCHARYTEELVAWAKINDR